VIIKILLILLILNIFVKKNIYLKFTSIFFLISICILSLNIIQKQIISAYLLKEKEKIENIKKYSIVILGGNHVKRLFKACEIINNYNVKNILVIKDYINQELKTDPFGCFFGTDIIKHKLIPRSTIDDYKIIQNQINKLSDDIILITDDFHVRRLSILLKNLEKNYTFYTIMNIEKKKYDKLIDINHAIKLFNILTKEFIAIIYYKFFL
jgi:hypothetical protein